MKLLQEIDELLASLEDSAHGQEGKAISEMRGKIQKELCPDPVDGDKALAIEILARFTGNSRGTPIAKKAFIDGVLWERSKINT